jgi:omega-6 fatty acid desaturase (delta-12 desaturase)
MVALIFQQLLGWIVYLSTNISGQNYKGKAFWQVNHFNPNAPLFTREQRMSIIYSDIGMLLTLSALWVAYTHIGFANLALMYFVPYLWVNHWLVFITYLQHTDPAIPHYKKEVWTFERGAAATMDRDFGFIGRFIFHRIFENHVLHHLCSRIPHYNAEEATQAIRKVMGTSYMSDKTNMFISLWRSARMCQYVSDKDNIVFYRNANRLGANYDGRFDPK